MKTLPEKLVQFLLDQPETSEDLHVVTVTLKNGRTYEDVAVTNCSVIAAVRGYAHVPFDAGDVAQLYVTHRRWGLGQQPLSS